MNDSESRTYAQRVRLVQIASAQEGAHYLLGATGGVPDMNMRDVWYFHTRVQMYPNRFDRHRPILLAARTQLRTDNFCAGRSSMYPSGVGSSRQRIRPVPGNQAELDSIANPENYLWPRPAQTLGGEMVYGESCYGKRHFDCMHFVNWCVSNLRQTNTHHGILEWFDHSRHVYPGVPDPMVARLGTGAAQVWAGDIEISRSGGHIGLLTGNTVDPRNHLIHAMDTRYGVRRTPFNPNNPSFRTHEASVRRLLFFLQSE